MRLKGLTAAVVGVGSSIGKACAVTFAREGAHVLAVDPDENVAAAVCKEIADAGGMATPHQADFASKEGADSVAQRCEELWQRLDILIPCGSEKDWWPLEEDSVELWESIVKTNLLGPIIYTKQLAHLLKRSEAGSIIYLGTIDGKTGNPNLPSYSVSKGGLIPLTHVMAHEFGRHHVRVNCIATAAIEQTGTGAKPNLRGDTSEASERLRLTPVGRHARPDDVATVALFFASSDSAYVSGTVLPVDGGRTAITPGTVLHDQPA